MKSNSIFKLCSLILIASVLAGLVGAVTPQVAHAANLQPVQVFYLPMPEDQVIASFHKITTATVAGPMHSVTGIAVTNNGTVIYYDQWENGYELDLANPTNIWSASNPGGTQIWGNGNAADGCPPNIDGKTALTCTNANDVLVSGNTIVLENDVPSPRLPTDIRYDARDKVGSTKVVAVTRSIWAATPGTVLTDAIEVYDTTRWGTSYEVPVGQNVSANNMFSYSSLLITAAQNGTTVHIDANADGTAETTVNMNQGDVYQVNGRVNAGATVTANNPIQVDMVTGRVGSTYACRWFHLPPTNLWTSSLWTAVGTTNASYPAAVFLFNPDNTNPLTINYQTKLGTGTVSVPANGVIRFQMPLKSGAHFWTSGATFLAVGAMDSSTGGTDQTYDWGYTLVSDAWLTSGFVAGWAPGTGEAAPTHDGSPVWVTSTKATTIYVDYGSPAVAAPNTAPNGAKYDVSYAIGAYESLQIVGVNNTQTGMKVFTADQTSITGAWGEDPTLAQAGTPYLDVGYTIPPLPEVLLTKSAAVDSSAGGDVNSNGKIDPGDRILYTLAVHNNGAVTAFNTVVTDSTPANTTYVRNSTTLTITGGSTVSIPDDPTVTSGDPLQKGYAVGQLFVGQVATFTYKMQANVPPPAYTSIVNTAHALIDGVDMVITISTPVNSNASQCVVNFTGTLNGSNVTVYNQNGIVYVKLVDADTAGKGPIKVAVIDPTTTDREIVTLTETGSNTGIFVGSVSSSTTTGQSTEDGTLYARAGDTITINYADPVYLDTCSASAAVLIPSLIKTLYLDDSTQNLTRVSPVATGDSTTLSTGNLSTSAGTQTVNVTLYPTKDTTLNLAAPTYNYGLSPSLTDERTTTGKQRILLGFDVSSLPSNATITVATLSLYKTGSNNASSTRAYTTDIFGLTSAWNEGTGSATGTANMGANWNQRITGTNWGTGGGDYNSGTLLAQQTVTTNINGWYAWPSTANMTNLVKSWITTPSSNYGLLVKRTSETSTTARSHIFASKDNSDSTIRPKLDITYTIPVAVANTTTFQQSAAMADTFSLPNGGTVTVTSYLHVVSGTMPVATPSSLTVTADVGITGNPTSIISFATPSAITSLGGNVYQVTWTGVLGSAKTINPNDKISYRVTTAYAGLTFYLDFGSSTRPAKIDLPTTTVIKVNSLNFYDAPYPGGSQILNPANGQTIYVRGVVSDPFGPYDITSATLGITGPSYTLSAVTLNDSYVVASDAKSKTYEYAWAAPATQGAYSFTFTGKEGLENTISDTLTNSANIIFKDTGTPSTTEFTSGSNGAATSSYDQGASSTNLFCMRVTDYNRNTNPALAETVSVTVTSTSGDSQVVTLTETGVNTGVFVACISRDTASSTNTSTLFARQGDQLTVRYTDTTDPTDQSSATATMTTTSTMLVIGKQLVTPANGFAAVGTTIRFDLSVSNPSASDLTTVQVTDTYPPCLSFVSANNPPDSTSPTLVWGDVGPLTSHQSYSNSVFFHVDSVCVPAATSNGLTATAIDQSVTATPVSAAVTTTRPQLSITKALISGSPVLVGNDVTFNITLTNTGTTSISNPPLTDTYSSYCMEVKSPISNGGVGGGGTIQWTSLGTLAASGGSVTIPVTFTARGLCAPATNLASVTGAVDSHGDVVPDVQTSANVTTQVQPSTFTVTKTLANPASGPAYVGDILTYTLQINNTGPNVLTQIVATDTYDSCLSLVSADVTPTSTPAGHLIWNTLVPPQPPLLTGTSMTITLQMKAVATSSGCNNSVEVTATDQFSNAAGDHTSAARAVEIFNALRGVVFNDANSSGIQDGGEAGLPNAVVNLFSAGPDGIFGTGDDVLVGTQTTTDGSFRFGALPAGSYQLRETNPTGYASTTSDSVTVSVPATGETVVNFGDRQGSASSGVVFNDLNANGVQDPGEAGISGVTVTLKNSGGSTVGTQTTDASGSYQFNSLAPGAYTVVETDPASYLSTTPNTVGVSLAAGGLGVVNYGDQLTGTVSGTVFSDLNGNGHSDAGESDIAFVSVSLVNSTGVIVATQLTDATGNYQFSGVAAGSYTVVENDPSGYVSTTANTVPVSVPSGGSAAAQFGDRPAGQVSGVVFNDLNGSGAQDAGEPGLSGVAVQLKNGSGATVATTTTDSTGAYLFSSVTAGSYSVVETDPAGFASVTANTLPISVPAGGSASANFADQTVGSVSGVVFNDFNGNGSQDAGEPGIGGVAVTLRNSGGSTVGMATTIANGSYLFSGVSAGAYSVVESDPTGFTSTTSNIVPVSVPAGGSASANFGDQQTGLVEGVVFNDMNGNGTQDAGEPGIGGVTVQLKDGSGSVAGTTTTSDGYYQFSPVSAGAYTVVESDPSGFSSTTANTVPVSVPANGSATANFGDRQSSTVSGVVYNDLNGNGVQDPGEPGLSGVSVELRSSGCTTGVNCPVALTAGDGSYLFTGLSSGVYTVAETDPSGFTSRTPNTVAVSLHAGGSASANFGDVQVGSINGVVYNDLNGNSALDSGEPGIGGVTVELRDSGGVIVSTALTAGDGSYHFGGLSGGSYTLVETDPAGYTSVTANNVGVSLPSSGTASANFGDRQVGTVSGVYFNDLNANGVQDAGEPGIGGVTVQLKDSTGATVIATTTTASDGSYLFTGVAAATYQVNAGAPTGFVATTPTPVSVTVPAGGSASANFGARLTGTVSGVVYNDLNGNGVQDSGEPGLGGVTIELHNSSGGALVGSTTTAGDGSYLFTGVSTGSYNVIETADPIGFSSTTANTVGVTVPSGGSASANFGDRQIGTISGVVFNDLNSSGAQNAGEPGLGGVTVQLKNSGGTVIATTTTAADGSYQFTGIGAGSYTVVEIDPSGFTSTTPNSVAVTVPAGGSASANFGDTSAAIVIVAVDDSGALINGTFGGTSLANVLANDTLNGAPATTSTVNLTLVGTPPAGLHLDTATGAVTVDAGTAYGTYTLTYKICDKVTPTICDTATVSVPVVVIDAVNDSGTAVTETAGGQSVANVLVNDTLNGAPAAISTVNLTAVGTLPAGLHLNLTTGAVTVDPNTPASTYHFDYQICDKANPAFCDTATVTVPVTPIVDLVVTNDDSVTTVNANSSTTYTLTLTNNGPSAADNSTLSDPAAVGLSKTALGACVATGGAVCPAAGSGAGQLSIANLEAGTVVVPTLPMGGSLTFTVTALVTGAQGTTVTNIFSAAPPAGMTDPTPATASDTDHVNTPTAVDLLSFKAIPQTGYSVTVTWIPVSETNTTGYNLYRSESQTGPWVKVNAELIPAHDPGSASGSEYSITDGAIQPRVQYYYRVEAIDASLAPHDYGVLGYEGYPVFAPIIMTSSR